MGKKIPEKISQPIQTMHSNSVNVSKKESKEGLTSKEILVNTPLDYKQNVKPYENYVQKSTTIAQTDDEISAAPVILTSPTNQEVSMQSKTSQRVQTQDQKAPVDFGQAPVSKPAKKNKVSKTKKTTTSADQDTSKKTDTTTDNGIRVSPVRETLKPEISKPETSTSSKPAALDVETKTKAQSQELNRIAVAKKQQEMKQKAAAIKRAKELSEQKKEKMKKEKARRTAAAKEAGRLAKLQREKIQFDKKEKEKAERLIQKEKTTKEEKEK